MVLICIIIFFILLKLAISYRYYTEFDDSYITAPTDFDEYSYRYEPGRLFWEYKKLCPSDKLFIRDLICHEVLKYKQHKPSFKKMCRSASKQILGTSMLSSVMLGSSIAKTVTQNSLGYFVSNVI